MKFEIQLVIFYLLFRLFLTFTMFKFRAKVPRLEGTKEMHKNMSHEAKNSKDLPRLTE